MATKYYVVVSASENFQSGSLYSESELVEAFMEGMLDSDECEIYSIDKKTKVEVSTEVKIKRPRGS